MRSLETDTITIRMDTITISAYFKNPCNINIVGSSGSGETSLTKRIIEQRDSLFHNKVEGIVFCYSNEQEIYSSIPDVTWYKGFPSLDKIQKWSQQFNGENYILIFDDWLVEMTGEYLHQTEALFTKHARHNKVTVIWLSQNLFMRNSRVFSLNSHYFLLLSAKRDKTQVSILGRQIFPGKTADFMAIYNNALKASQRTKPFPTPGYLLINCHSFHPEFNLITCIFPDDKTPILYKIL
jgi:hypothetical protein